MRLVDLMPLQEIDFPNQRAFDQYNKVHKLRPDTKVTVAGRVTTAGRAALDSKDIKGTSVFSNDAEKNAQDTLANDNDSGFKVTYVDDKGKTQIANTFKSKEDAEDYAKYFSSSSQVKISSNEEPEGEPFSGGSNVLDKVPELLPIGSGFTHKKTGNEIIVKGYQDNHMLVSHEKYPNKILRWPMKQFLKMTANKELQFHPKSK